MVFVLSWLMSTYEYTATFVMVYVKISKDKLMKPWKNRKFEFETKKCQQNDEAK